jgi:Ca2+-binding RTX toxin-like protein
MIGVRVLPVTFRSDPQHGNSILVAALAAAVSVTGPGVAQPVDTGETLTAGPYISPVWTEGFVGSFLRDFSGSGLTVTVNSTEGGFDTAFGTNYNDTSLVDDMHPDYFIRADFDVSGTGDGYWFVGPKIGVGWSDGPDNSGWFENYVVVNSSISPAEFHQRNLDQGATYLGETQQGCDVYRHYVLPFGEWTQFWAVKQSYDDGGVVMMKPILDLWRENGLPNKMIDSLRLNIETGGEIDLTFTISDIILPIGFPSDPGAPPIEHEKILGGAGQDDLCGAAGNDTLIGWGGNDALHGNGGNDWLNGGTGDDRIYGGAGNDWAVFAGSIAVTVNLGLTAAQDTGHGRDTIRNVENVTSGSGNDRLTGSALNNLLNGGLGTDTLTGGAGRDGFIFKSALGAGNIDHITDFKAIDDTIRLDDAIFAGLASGKLAASAFAANLTGRASDSLDRIIYETDTGRLFFDADGSGAGGRIQFATLRADLVLTNTDFFVF